MEDYVVEIVKKQDKNTLELSIIGRLDTTTAPNLEAVLKESLEGVSKLVFDFKDLEYISSAGLRLILTAQKAMNKRDGMIIRNVGSDIMEVFEITGFLDILTIE